MANIIGIIGVVLCMIPYLLMMQGKLDPRGTVYPGLNLIGSICLLISLMVYWNLASVVIETIWFGVSLYGTIRAYVKRDK